MAKEDLIDISTRPDFKEITHKGGSVKSQAKKDAAKLRGIKLMSQKTLEKKSLGLIQNPDASALQIMQVIKELLDKNLPDKIKIELLGKMVQAHTAIHGIKSKNLNIGLTKQIVEVRFKDKDKENENEREDRDKGDSIKLFTPQKSKNISSKEAEV